MHAVWIAIVVAAVGAGAFFGFQRELSESPMFFVVVGAPTCAFGIAAILRARKDGVLADRLRPKWGDFSLAALGAVALYALAWAFTRLVTAPGSRRTVWLMSLYGQLGRPSDLQAHALSIGVAIFVLAAMEELLWRGLVTDLVAERVGSRSAWIVAAVLYAVAHVPSMWPLRADAGLNPILPIAALGAGLFWGAMTQRTGRLLPAILSHALFDWAVVMMYPLWSAPNLPDLPGLR